MTYVPKTAYKLQSFSDIKELNKHMNFHYVHIKHVLTECFDKVFHLLKKYSCKVPGVCWIKQEKIADLLHISIKTVERAIKFLKEKEILKIHHTKRGNINANAYYVLQPCRKFLEEEIVLVEEAIVGTNEVLQALEPQGFRGEDIHHKLFKSSLENSLKNSKINSDKLHLSKVQNFISKHQARIEKRRIDIQCIWDVYDMQLIMNDNVFLIVLDRVIDQYKTNFRSCLQRALLNESEQVTNRQPLVAKPIREEMIPKWFYHDDKHVKPEMISEHKETYHVGLNATYPSSHNEEPQHVKERMEAQANYEAKKAELEERLKKYRNHN
ncbi:hypothetical protein [Bacillus dakarensis]|uniref:hypothetical protein n=1 Tax=Robertmurraya dakarensis TaxID=1926278 RepID=UPI0009810CB9|nr:hypothetical protein [Bacillus dakarensis]